MSATLRPKCTHGCNAAACKCRKPCWDKCFIGPGTQAVRAAKPAPGVWAALVECIRAADPEWHPVKRQSHIADAILARFDVRPKK